MASQATITGSIVAAIEDIGSKGGRADTIKIGQSGIPMAFGTAAGQFNELWGDERLYGTSPVTLALDSLASALTNKSKASVFTNVRGLLIANTGSAGNLIWNSSTGGAPTNPFLGGFASAVALTLPPKAGILLWIPDAGIAVSTAKNIKLEGSVANVLGYLGLIGLK